MYRPFITSNQGFGYKLLHPSNIHVALFKLLNIKLINVQIRFYKFVSLHFYMHSMSYRRTRKTTNPFLFIDLLKLSNVKSYQPLNPQIF